MQIRLRDHLEVLVISGILKIFFFSFSYFSNKNYFAVAGEATCIFFLFLLSHLPAFRYYFWCGIIGETYFSFWDAVPFKNCFIVLAFDCFENGMGFSLCEVDAGKQFKFRVFFFFCFVVVFLLGPLFFIVAFFSRHRKRLMWLSAIPLHCRRSMFSLKAMRNIDGSRWEIRFELLADVRQGFLVSSIVSIFPKGSK